MQSISLKSSTIKLFGETSYIHNDINLDDYFKNNSVSMGVRIMAHFASLYSLDSNKDKAPEDRIFISNSGILRALGYDVEDYRSKHYEEHLSAVQSVLERWEKDSDSFIIREFKNSIGEWIPLYNIDEKGNKIYNIETLGLTRRRIRLNVTRLKELFTALPEQAKSFEIKKRSRAKKVLNARPVTLVDYLMNKIIKTQVNDVQTAKKLNDYLRYQLSIYGDFSDVDDVYLEPISEAGKYAKIFANNSNASITISLLSDPGGSEN